MFQRNFKEAVTYLLLLVIVMEVDQIANHHKNRWPFSNEPRNCISKSLSISMVTGRDAQDLQQILERRRKRVFKCFKNRNVELQKLELDEANDD